MSDTRVKERRHSGRVLLSVPVRVEALSAEEPRENETANFSETGVYICSQSPLASSTEVNLTFHLPDLDSRVQATGIVVRSNDGTSNSGEPAGMAVEFRKHGKLSWHLLRRLLEAQAQTGSPGSSFP